MPWAVFAASVLVLVAGAAEWERYAWAEPTRWGPDLVVGLGWIGLGLFVVLRTPARGTGLLMLACGGCWFIGNFAGLGPDAAASVAAQLTYLHRGVLAQLLVAFPRALPAGRASTAVVLVSYAVAAVPSLARASWVTLTLCVLVVASAGLRAHRATGRARSSNVLVLFASLALLVGLALGVLSRAEGGVGDEAGLLIYQVSLLAVGALLAVAATRLVPANDEVRRLAVELADGRSTALEAALRDALGDDTLAVGFWSPEHGSYLDAAGSPLGSDAGSGRTLTIIEPGGEPLLGLEHDSSTTFPAEVTRSLDQASLLIETNVRLHRQLQRRVDELAVARRRLVDADARERSELEHQLAQGAGKSLEQLDDTLATASRLAGPITSPELRRAEALLEATRADLERLARGLYPATLTRAGLATAVQELAEQVPLPVRVRVEGEVPRPLREIAFFVCAEGLANVTKHAHAQSAAVTVRRSLGVLTVEVADDGVGTAAACSGWGSAAGSGLRGLADRVAAYGGVLDLTDVPSGGARLSMEIPLDGHRLSAESPDGFSRPSPNGAP
jgi:signal transduction histidine kinase